MKQKKALLLDETQERLDWMKQKKGLLLDETQKERFDWIKHKVIDLIGGNMYRAI